MSQQQQQYYCRSLEEGKTELVLSFTNHHIVIELDNDIKKKEIVWLFPPDELLITLEQF